MRHELRFVQPRAMGDFTPTERQAATPIPPAPPVRPSSRPATETRLQYLLRFAKKEIEEAESELGSDSREFANYCAILIIHLTSKHLPENE